MRLGQAWMASVEHAADLGGKISAQRDWTAVSWFARATLFVTASEPAGSATPHCAD